MLPTQTKNKAVKALPAVNVQVGGGGTAKAAEGTAAVAAADSPARGWCRHVPSQVCEYENVPSQVLDKVCAQPDNLSMIKYPTR